MDYRNVMRILITTMGHWQDRPSGSAKIAYDDAVELVRRGVSAWILAPAEASLPEHEPRDGVHLLRYTPANLTFWNPARASAYLGANGMGCE